MALFATLLKPHGGIGWQPSRATTPRSSTSLSATSGARGWLWSRARQPVGTWLQRSGETARLSSIWRSATRRAKEYQRTPLKPFDGIGWRPSRATSTPSTICRSCISRGRVSAGTLMRQPGGRSWLWRILEQPGVRWLRSSEGSYGLVDCYCCPGSSGPCGCGDEAPPTRTRRAPWGVTPQEARYYYRARYYDPRVGRFISEDPIGFDGGVNFYSYVEGNPVSWIDPWGLHHYTPTAGERANEDVERWLACMDRCTNMDLAVTAGREGGHSTGSAHETGQACDLGKNSNPGLDPATAERCFNQCGTEIGNSWYGQEEGNHYHYQSRPGVGGAQGYRPTPRPSPSPSPSPSPRP